FLNEAVPSYQLPSGDILQKCILTKIWTNMSGNSIYRFMILKENQEYIVDIVDLSANRHIASFIISQTKEILARNEF
ncbi:12601_t:CDS:2, partial [Dentiscutata heterogama]